LFSAIRLAILYDKASGRIWEPVSTGPEKIMHPALKVSSGGQLVGRATRWRLTAALGAAAIIGASAVSIAPPASADTVDQKCGTYNSWTECISYDYNNGNLAVNALNGYSTSETESLWMEDSYGDVFSEGFVIPAHSWAGFSVHWGPISSGIEICAGIDSVKIVCNNFNSTS
jgi:hypothetical protein